MSKQTNKQTNNTHRMVQSKCRFFYAGMSKQTNKQTTHRVAVAVAAVVVVVVVVVVVAVVVVVVIVVQLAYLSQSLDVNEMFIAPS